MTTTVPAVLCPRCRAPLFEIGSAVRSSCVSCRAVYSERFGILDLRGNAPLRIAGVAFDVGEDLREAKQIQSELARAGFVEWFFSGVDRSVAQIDDPKKRDLARQYFAAEREVFGKHGSSVLEKLDRFLEEAEPRRHERWRRSTGLAIEAGCGGGQYPIGFVERFAQVLVVDLSYTALVQAKRIAEDFNLNGVQLIAANLEDLPVSDGVVDFFHCNAVIEHVADPERVVRESARVLSPDGIAFFLSPNLESLYLEAHFRVPAFGWWPMPLRRALARRFSGARDLTGTELRSLGDLRSYARGAFPHFRVYMLPRRLVRTARGGILRKAIVALLGLPLVGTGIDFLINRMLLRFMPYHILVGFRNRT